MDFDFFDVAAPAAGGPPPPPDAGGDKPKGRKKIITNKPAAAAKKKPKKAVGGAKGKKKVVKKGKAGASAGASGNNDLDDFLGDLDLGGGAVPAAGGDDLGMDDFFGGGGGNDNGGDDDNEDEDDVDEEEEEAPTPKKGKKNKNGAVSIDDADFGFDLDDLKGSVSSKKGGKKKKKGGDIDDIDLDLDDLAISEGGSKKKDKKKKGGATNIDDLDLQGSITSALAVEKKKISNLDELDFTGAVKVKEGALDDFLGPGGDLTESTSGALDSNNGVSYMETSGCNEPEMQKLGKDKIQGFYISDDQGKLLFHREYMKQKKRGDEIDPEHGFYEQVKTVTQPLWQDSVSSYQATVIKEYPVVFGTLNGYIMYLVGSGMYDEIFCQFILGEIVTLISQLGVKKFTPETWKDTNFIGKFYTALDEMILDGCIETLDQGFIDRQAKLKPFKF